MVNLAWDSRAGHRHPSASPRRADRACARPWFPVMRRGRHGSQYSSRVTKWQRTLLTGYFGTGFFLHSRNMPSPLLLRMRAVCRGTFVGLDYELTLRAVSVKFYRMCHVECVGVNYGKFCSILVLAFCSPPRRFTEGLGTRDLVTAKSLLDEMRPIGADTSRGILTRACRDQARFS